MNKELYHSFRKDERSAEVYRTSKGFEVELYEQNGWYGIVAPEYKWNDYEGLDD